MSASAVTTFLAQLRQAQILEETQLAEAERLGKTAARPAEVASELIKRGWLTPYQANQIARGRGQELVLASYVVLEPLATGGMGQVVKARHRFMGRTTALKLIRHDQRESADSVQRFQREVRLLAELRHPHIVHAYDAGNVDAVWFLAMELLEGIDLDRLVRQRGPLPASQACDFIRQAALGLAHAHERGLVHRDIKPSNLFLTGEGIKILDLGLARPQALGDEKQPGDLTRANTVMGTPDYLAPEQALDPRRADARSDLYSLGCTLYALLTGRPPFPEGTLAQKLLYHQTAEPPAVETLRPELPAALAGLVRRLLAKSPAQRPASAAAVAAELGPLAAPGPDWLADTRRPKTTSVPGPSLVNAKTDAPQPGFTLTTDSLPPAAAASLLNARAAAPERGWTLAAESLPPAAPPSLIEAQHAAPERGFTLVAETLPPTPASSGQSTAGAQQRHAALTAERPAPSPPGRLWSGLLPWQRRLALGIGVVCLLLPLLLVGVRWLGGGAGEPDPGPQAKQAEPVKKAGPPPSWLFPNGPRRYLAELQEFDVRPGQWPFKKGDCGDGRPIQVGGVVSPHGLGMHPPSALGLPGPAGTPYAAVKFRLGKEAERFKATVAINDTTKWCFSPATFVVLGDGKELWRSRYIGHMHERSQDCDVVIQNVDVLELRVQVVNGNVGVHAVWVEPRVLQKLDTPDGPGEPTVEVKPPRPKDKNNPGSLEPTGPKETKDLFVMRTIAPDTTLAEHKAGAKVFLSDMKEFAFKTTPTNWGFAKNGLVGDPKDPAAQIRVNGKAYAKGLGMHPPNTDYIRVCYALGKRGETLRGSVALADGKSEPWNIETTFFTVIGNGKVLWRSQGIKDRGVVEPFTVDVRDVAVLELRVYTDYNGANDSRAVWLDPYVVVSKAD